MYTGRHVHGSPHPVGASFLSSSKTDFTIKHECVNFKTHSEGLMINQDLNFRIYKFSCRFAKIASQIPLSVHNFCTTLPWVPFKPKGVAVLVFAYVMSFFTCSGVLQGS